MDSTSSKITVEYHDPSGVFSFVSRKLAACLPLHNLNWQTPSRPPRQIRSLNVDFVPDSYTRERERPPSQRSSTSTPNGTATSFDIVRGGPEHKRLAVKERRHQIPGLQTSPFLKLYLLRCDDRDTYKATARQKLRTWIRDEAAAVSAKAKGKGKGENHDAFEWLIIHVVVPDTIAASESRWRVSQKDADELKERKQGAKWPGKKSRTVFDKLRSDFDETGKTARDRVAQIRLLKSDIPADLLPTPAIAVTLEETNEEREKSFNDLTNKLKSLILEPFDRRVRQYEADIAEQETRRALPGFNFCTFFIHKEGLAKAFESIGLVEDALVIYDELSLGLETIIRDIATGRAAGTATSFAPFTDDIVERITGSKGKTSQNDASEKLATLFEKDYRQKIVTSSISIFDFVCYLFTRQKSLILRLANARTTRARFGPGGKEGGEDVVLTSEVCWRASNFIHNHARTLRQDLRANQRSSDKWDGTDSDVESLVSSWTYGVISQVLEETGSSALDQSESQRSGSFSNGSVTSPVRTDSSMAASSASSYPQRTTSLMLQNSRLAELQKKASVKSAIDGDVTSPASSTDVDRVSLGSSDAGALPGMPELATYRAELMLIRRKMLEHVAQQRGWVTGWAGLRHRSNAALNEVDLSEPTEWPDNEQPGPTTSHEASTLLAPVLVAALKDEATFHATYERLSETAMRSFIAATQIKSAESIMGDLAILKSQQGDFEYAAKYFQHVLPLYTSDGWDIMEAEALRIHAGCLKELGRKDEYVEALLTLVTKVYGREVARRQRFSPLPTIDDDLPDTDGLLSELIQYSTALSDDISSPADKYFSNIQLGRTVIRDPLEEQDGFSLQLHVEHLLKDEIVFDAIDARLVHIEDSAQEIRLTTSEVAPLKTGLNVFQLKTNVIATGPFLIDRIVLRAGKLNLIKEVHSMRQEPISQVGPTLSDKPFESKKPHQQPWVFIYPAEHAFDAIIEMNRHIQVDKPRSITLQLSSGWNAIENVEVRLKAASAGLRLHLADATLESIEESAVETTTPGLLHLGRLASNKTAYVRIPYSLEQPTQDINIRLECQYVTSKGTYTFMSVTQLPTALPLDVNVHDIFQLDALFSNFTVKTTNTASLLVTNVMLAPSAVYGVEGPPHLQLPMSVVKQQPLELLYKISRPGPVSSKISKSDAALRLSLYYWPLNELIEVIVRTLFAENLKGSPVSHLTRLILPFVSARMKSLLSNEDLEFAAWTNTVQVPAYDEIGWDEVVSLQAEDVKSALSTALHQIHEQHSQVELQHGALIGHTPRRISMPVEVPTIDIVHRASLAFPNTTSSPRLPTLSQGQPIQAVLQLESTRAWSTASIFPNTSPKPSPADSQFIYTLHADADTWLIGGARRARFTAAEKPALQSFEITLLPLRLGFLPLPSVDVQLGPKTSGSSSVVANEVAPSCETHCASAAEVVHVIRDARTTRVEVFDVEVSGET